MDQNFPRYSKLFLLPLKFSYENSFALYSRFFCSGYVHKNSRISVGFGSVCTQNSLHKNYSNKMGLKFNVLTFFLTVFLLLEIFISVVSQRLVVEDFVRIHTPGISLETYVDIEEKSCEYSRAQTSSAVATLFLGLLLGQRWKE